MNYLKLILCFIPFIGFSQENNKEMSLCIDFSKAEKSNYYEPNIKQVKIKNNLDSVAHTLILYDDNGNISFTGYFLYSKYTNYRYTFDSLNKVKSKELYSDYGRNTKPFQTYYYNDTSIIINTDFGMVTNISLDNKQNWIKEVNPYYSIIRNYNSNNNITDIRFYDNHDTLLFHETYKYGDNNKIILSKLIKSSESLYDMYTGVLISPEYEVNGKEGDLKKYTYNYPEKTIIETRYSLDNDSTFTKYLFDNYGNLIGEKDYRNKSDSEITHIKEFIYNDEKLIKIKYFENEVLKSTDELFYIYY